MASTTIAPISRLGADEWGYLSAFLGTNDICRLISIGYRPLSDRLRLGINHLKCTWTSGPCIDFSRLFSYVTQFNTLYSLEFRSQRKVMFNVNPQNWSSLPPTLVSLKLRFWNSFGIVVNSHIVGTICPALEVLEVYSRSTVERHIDLRRLPPSLRILRLSSLGEIFMCPQHLKNLPLGLEILELDFYYRYAPASSYKPLNKENSNLEETFAEFVSTSAYQREDLPKLPDSIHTLHLKALSPWNISSEALPRSLKHFSFEANRCVLGVSADEAYSTIDLKDASSLLPHLVTFSCPTVIPIQRAIKLLPPSLTTINAEIVSSSLSPELESIALKLSSYECMGWSPVDDLITDGSHVLPQLKTLKCSFFGSDELFIPDNVTNLSLFSYHNRLSLPKALKQLTILYRSTLPPSLPPYDRSYNLTRIDLPESILPHEWVMALPNTLERLSASMIRDTWLSLLDELHSKSRLPKLWFLRNFNHLDIRVLLDFPPQIRKAHIHVTSSSMTEPIDKELLLFLYRSKLTHLTIYIDSDHSSSQLPAVLALLNALPKNLIGLHFRSRCVPSLYWPVKLPERLAKLHFTDVGPVKNLEHYPQPSDASDSNNGNQELSTSKNTTFELPSTLEVLCVHCRTSPWSANNLPPHVSAILPPDSSSDSNSNVMIGLYTQDG